MIVSLDGSDWKCKDFIGADWLGRSSHLPGSRDLRGWRPATVPGSIQNDLWAAGEVPDPYFERNSLLLEWAPQRTWVYKKTFQANPAWKGEQVRLRFKGVDYAAQFFLNGELLGEHASMYTPAAFEVGERLNYEKDNLLVVVLAPAPSEEPQIGYSSRVRTHKARMNYWWDFCPRMVHLGLWDTVSLEITGPVRLEDVWVQTELSPDLQDAEVTVTATVSAIQEVQAELLLSICMKDQVIASQSIPAGLSACEATLVARFVLPNPSLWWPNGYGEQALYALETRIVISGQEVPSDERQVNFGVRTIELVANETPDPTARPYTLQVNGRKVYLTGWNWVPMDVLYGVERPEKGERLLQLARRAHVNLLRVWGGGLVEKDSFYDLCDRLGLMVWQEFIQSSSGIENLPPQDPGFIEQLVQEAQAIIPLKRNHPALVIWCGGNELQVGPEQPADESQPLLAALREVVETLDPGRCWLPTSPSGRLFSNSLENIARDPLGLHDVHGPWEYQGLEKHYTLYNQGTSLLHSEFGAEGITNPRTLDRVIQPERQSPVSLDNPLWRHLGAWWVKLPMWQSVFGPVEEVSTLTEATQWLQAEGLRYAVEADRRRMFHNSGTLPWQFNEPYPMAACTSAVDYFAQPKPVYYAVARAYAPLSITAQYPRLAWQGYPNFEAEVWAVWNGSGWIEPGSWEAVLLGAGGQEYAHWREPAIVPANSSIHLGSITWPLENTLEEIFVLDLRLKSSQGQTLSANRYLFSREENLAPLLALPRPQIKRFHEDSGDRQFLTLINSGPSLVPLVFLEDSRDPARLRDGTRGWVYFDDNAFSLLPGESRTVHVQWVAVPMEERQVFLRD